MNTTRQFKFGLVGCGRISQTYVQSIKAIPHAVLTAVMDVRPEAAHAAAEAADCAAFTELEEFAVHSGVDAAIICSPPLQHREIACRLMDEGMHILCEKPIAINRDDVEAMAAKAVEKDRFLMMASKFRYVEDIIRAKAIIASGMLGEIQFYENRFCSKVNMLGRWNADPAIAGGGVLIDNGTHSVDIVRYLLGPVERVFAHDGRRVAGLPVEDTASLSFITENNLVGNIYLSWTVHVDQGGYVNVHGTDGSLSVGWQESKYQHNGHPEWIRFGVGYNKIDAFKGQVVNFMDAIRGVAQPIITMQDAICSVEVIEAAYKSMQERNWTTVEKHSSSPQLAVAGGLAPSLSGRRLG